MLRRYRLLFAALAGLALAGASPPTERAPSGKAASEVEPTSTPSIDYSPDPDRKAESCYQNRDHDAADLCAQWAAADAAKQAADAAQLSNIIAIAGAALSFVGILLVLAALRQGRKANDIARDAIINQDRAWLTVDIALTGSVRLEGDPPEVRIDVDVRVTNIGTNPARNVGLDIHLVDTNMVESWDKQKRLAEEFRKVPPKHWLPGGTLFKGEHLTQPTGIGSSAGALARLRTIYPEAANRVPLILAVVGCAQYQLPGSDRIHQTGFVLELYKATPKGRVILFETDLPADNSKVRLLWPIGGYSNIT